MKKTNILEFTISFILFFCNVSLSQNTYKATPKGNHTQKAEVHIPFTKGIKIGVDLYKPIREFFNDQKLAYELIAKWNIYTNFFSSTQIGYEQRDFKNDKISTSGQGFFFKTGIHYNFLNRHPTKNDVFYIGGHYGFSIFSQSMKHTIQDKITQTKLKQNIPKTQYTPHWLSMCVGIDVEILPFIFFGWEVAISSIVANRYVNGIDAIYIPGIGEHNDGVSFSFIYTISAFIPFENY